MKITNVHSSIQNINQFHFTDILKNEIRRSDKYVSMFLLLLSQWKKFHFFVQGAKFINIICQFRKKKYSFTFN